MDIDDAAQRLGALAWSEQRLFEISGGWVVSTPEPDVKLRLARASRHHGDHALALVAVLPDTRDHDPAELVARPSEASEDVVAALEGAADTPARVDALVLVLSRQRVALEGFLAEASPIRDGPAQRVVRLVLEEDVAEAEALAALRA